jgi:hypothetical protein
LSSQEIIFTRLADNIREISQQLIVLSGFIVSSGTFSLASRIEAALMELAARRRLFSHGINAAYRVCRCALTGLEAGPDQASRTKTVRNIT